MGVFNKLKSIFYDEVLVDEEPEEEISKVDRVIKNNKIEEEPKVEKINFTPIDDVVEEEHVEKKTDNTFSERELFRSERTFNFTEFDDEEELPPRKNVLNNEVKVSTTLDVKSSIPQERTFKPSPVISPIYGILDKDYRKEEIKTKKDGENNNVMNIKVTNYDTVRRKAYGTLEDELEDTLNSINSISTETINQEVENIKRDVESLERTSKIEDLIDKIEEIDEEIDKTMSVGELEDQVELDNFEDEEEVEDKTMTDSTLEHDLFNLIDSMYDDKEE